MGKILTDNLLKLGDIKAAFIYGSFARGSAGGKSDIDLFIIGQVHEDELIRCIEKLETQFSREINYVLFTPDELNEKEKAYSSLWFGGDDIEDGSLKCAVKS